MIYLALWVAAVLFLGWVGFIVLSLLLAIFSPKKSPDYSHLTHTEILVQHGERYARQKPRRELIQKLECGHPMGAGRPADEYSSEPYCAWCRQCRGFLEEIARLESVIKQSTKPKVLVFSPPSKENEDFCKCGYPGCIGHEIVDEVPTFPGLTSANVMADMMERGSKFMRFDVEVARVPGNPL